MHQLADHGFMPVKRRKDRAGQRRWMRIRQQGGLARVANPKSTDNVNYRFGNAKDQGIGQVMKWKETSQWAMPG